MSLSYTRISNKKFYKILQSMGVLAPGGKITRKQVYAIFNLNVSALITHAECSQLKTMLIGPIDYVRRNLLSQGMYFAQEKSDFRVYALEENKHAVRAYARRARNSCIRGQILNDNTATKYMKFKKNNTTIFDKCIDLLSNVK